MKKLIGVAVLVLAGWLGATAYISSTFKGEFESYIERVNRVYESQGISYKAEVKSSFFTSDVNLEIHIDEDRLGKAVTDVYADFIQLPIKVAYEVEHGPVFVANGLGLGFAKFTAQMKASEFLSKKLNGELLEAIPEDITLYITEVLCFDKKLKVRMDSNKISFKKKSETVEIEPLVGSGVIDTQTLLGTLDITLPKITVEGKDAKALIQGTTLHIDMKDMLNEKYLLGDIVFKVDEIKLEKEGFSKAATVDFKVDVDTKREEGDFMAASIDMVLNQEGLEQFQPTANEMPKKINFSVDFNGFSVNAIEKLEAVNQKQIEMMDSLYAVMMESDASKVVAAQKSAEQAQESFVQTSTEAMQALLVKDRTKMRFGLNMTTKDDATSSIDVAVGYVGETLNGSLEEMTLYLQTKPLEYLTLDIDLNIYEKHIAFNASPKEQQQAKMGFALAVMQGAMKHENGVYSTKLEYKPKTLKINGQDKTQEILPLLEMSLGQGMMK